MPLSSPAASDRPSAEKATAPTVSDFNVIVWRGLPKASQRRTVPSSAPLASVLPSGDHDRHVTSASWPAQRASSLPVATLQRLTRRSCPADASSLPSGEKASDRTTPP